MSYNPAFVGDESPLGGSTVADKSSSSDGIKLTSFKVLPASQNPQHASQKQQTGVVVNICNAGSGKRRKEARASGESSPEAQGPLQAKRTSGSKLTTISNLKTAKNTTTSGNNNNNNNNNNNSKSTSCISTSSSLSLIDNPTLSSLTPSASSYSTTTSQSSSIVSASGLCAAVECRNMRYDVGRGRNQKTILYNINVTVPEGSIYGLLGPSGCGKTTMLRCVVGRIKPKEGYVRVFGYKPNDSGSQIPGPAIGYMPQEISVYEDFTINETLTYFGKINKMKQDLIDARIEFLLNFLDLPGKNRLIASLSGGQKRRVSLAAALVHSPPLLILDEPTVGVDPLLRQSIWKHLVTLAQTEKITVVITTHYIEEARQANVVGLMRHGKLLAEDSPDNLMAQHGMDNLEDVFLKLCISDSSRKAAMLAGLTVGSPPSDVLVVKDTQTRDKLAGKPQQVLLDANGLPITLQPDQKRVLAKKKRQFPSIFVLTNNEKPAVGGDGELEVNEFSQPVVMEESEASSEATENAEELEEKSREAESGTTGKQQALELTGQKQEKQPDFVVNRNNLRSMVPGTKYAPKKVSAGAWLKSLLAVIWKNYIRLKRNPPVLIFEFILPAVQVILFCLCIGGDPFDVPLAVVNDEVIPQASKFFLDAIDKNAIRQVPFSNLSLAIESVRRGETWGAIHIPDRYTQYLQERLTHPADITNETLTNGTINIYPDLTNLHLALAMENTFREAFIKFAKDTLNMFGYDPETAELPIRVEEPVYGTLKRNGYLEFMAPGVVISITYVMATGLTALAFILEKRDGLLERSLVSGVTTSQILLAHASVQVLVMIIQISLVLAFTFFVFEIPSNGPFFWVILLILLQGCTGMGFGLLVSAVCEEENTAVMMLVGTFYTNLILAGIIWPLEAMPLWLRWFSYAQPQTLPTETLRNILSRGWGIGETGVYLGFLVTIGWLIVFLLAAGLLMRYTNKILSLKKVDQANQDPQTQLKMAGEISASFLVISAILSTIVIGTMIGNVFVIIAILIDKNLQTTANQLVLSLAVADLMVACLVMPLGAYNDLHQGWFLGKEVCEFWTSADVLCCTASILNLLAIALDRYWAVTSVDYIYKRTKRRVNMMIMYAWMVGAIVSLAPIFGWKDPDFAQRVLVEHKCMVSQDVAYQIFATISTFYAPLVLLLALYWRIFKVARKRIRRKPGRNETLTGTGQGQPTRGSMLEGGNSAPPGCPKMDSRRDIKQAEIDIHPAAKERKQTQGPLGACRELAKVEVGRQANHETTTATTISGGPRGTPGRGRLLGSDNTRPFRFELSTRTISNSAVILMMRRLTGSLAPYRWLRSRKEACEQTTSTGRNQEAPAAASNGLYNGDEAPAVIEWVQTRQTGPPNGPDGAGYFAGQAPEDINDLPIGPEQLGRPNDLATCRAGRKPALRTKVRPSRGAGAPEDQLEAQLSNQIESLLRLVGEQGGIKGRMEFEAGRRAPPMEWRCCCCCCATCARIYAPCQMTSKMTGEINHAKHCQPDKSKDKASSNIRPEQASCGKTLEHINNAKIERTGEISALNNLSHLSKRLAGVAEESPEAEGDECLSLSGDSRRSSSGSATGSSLCSQTHSCLHSSANSPPAEGRWSTKQAGCDGGGSDDIIIGKPIIIRPNVGPGGGAPGGRPTGPDQVPADGRAEAEAKDNDDKQHGPARLGVARSSEPPLGPHGELEYINDDDDDDDDDVEQEDVGQEEEEEQDQSDASLSASFPPPPLQQLNLKLKLRRRDTVAGKDLLLSPEERQGVDINNTPASGGFPATKRPPAPSLPLEKGNKEETELARRRKNLVAQGGSEFIAPDRLRNLVEEESRTCGELAKRQKHYGTHSSATRNHHNHHHHHHHRHHRRQQPQDGPFECSTSTGKPEASGKPQRDHVNDENMDKLLTAATSQEGLGLAVCKMARPISCSLSNPANPTVKCRRTQGKLDDNEANTLRGVVNLPEVAERHRRPLIVLHSQPIKSAATKLNQSESLNYPEQGRTSGTTNWTGGPATRSVQMRSLDLRRKFRVLGQLVSFVATNKGLNSSSGSSASRPSLLDEELGEHSWPAPASVQDNSRPAGSWAGKLDYAKSMAPDASSEIDDDRLDPPAMASGGRLSADRPLGSSSLSDAVGNNSDKNCEISTIKKLSTSLLTGGEDQRRKHQSGLATQTINPGPVNQLMPTTGSAGPKGFDAGACGVRRRQRENIEIKREKKAAKTLAIITGVFVCCWLPFFLNAIVMPICGPLCTPSDLVLSILLWLGYLNSLLNPIIYTIFSPDFRRAFRRLLCWPELCRRRK